MNTKTCTRCSNDKPEGDFDYKVKAKGTRQSICKPCKAEVNAQAYNTTAAERRRITRLQAIIKLGGACVCCGETNVGLLTFDHTNSDGNVHRASGTSGNAVAAQVLKGSCSVEIQVMCWNCNSGRAMNGGVCPHLTGTLDAQTELDMLMANKQLAKSLYEESLCSRWHVQDGTFALYETTSGTHCYPCWVLDNPNGNR